MSQTIYWPNGWGMNSYWIKSSQEDWGVTWDACRALVTGITELHHSSPTAVTVQYQTLVYPSPASICLSLHPVYLPYSIKGKLSRKERWMFCKPAVIWPLLSLYAGVQAYAYPQAPAVASQLQPARPLYPAPLSQPPHFQGRHFSSSALAGLPSSPHLLSFWLSRSLPFLSFLFKQLSWDMTYIPWSSLVFFLSFKNVIKIGFLCMLHVHYG